MSSANKPLSITDLCDDLLCQIFDRLSVKQVLSIQTVNKDFHRSSKKWLKTVDRLVCDYLNFSLLKTKGEIDLRSNVHEDSFRKTKQTLFPSLDKMLTVCTGIKIFDGVDTDCLTPLQVIHLVSRCPNLNQFSLEFGKQSFEDDDWTRLIELIKNCDVYLYISRRAPTKFIKHLEKLCKSGTRIKSIRFNTTAKSFLKTIAFFDESTRVEITFSPKEFPKLDRQVCNLISRRVDSLFIDSSKFKVLSVRRFLKLSHLLFVFNHPDDNPNVATLEFPRLESLTIDEAYESDGDLISCFFAAVRGKLDQLEELNLEFDNFTDHERRLTEILEKTPNITKLRIDWLEFLPTKIPNFEKLFQFLSQSSARIRTLKVILFVKNLNNSHFSKVNNSMIRFARRKPKINLEITFE